MQGVFLKAGKYKNIPGSIVITEKDVKDKKVFNINDDNAKYFIEAGVFRAGAKPEKKEPVKKEPVKKEVPKATDK